jgi:Fe(3+) dicitrate transport protein
MRTFARPACIVATLLAAPGFADETAETTTRSLADTQLEIVTVLGRKARTETLSGSHQTLDASDLADAHVMTTSEALRKVAGVHVRDEEGFGLRPNIGLRGLNPTRSTKVLLLEDGIPLAYAPYGDNASYYHPPVDRFDRIEILKGTATNLFGPQTVGGVVNYITPAPPEQLEGFARIAAGNRDYLNTHAAIGAAGMRLDVVSKRGNAARENSSSELLDVNGKGVFGIGSDHTLILRANRYLEDSDLTYSGLTDAELARFGHRYNPFDNDTFVAGRTGLSVTHDWSVSPTADLTTNLYYGRFSRDWWRQASTTTDTQCNAVTYTVDGQLLNFAAARAAGFAVNPDDCASRQGRLREYESYGVEPRLRIDHGLFGLDNELIVGARAHAESQTRRQVNALAPTARRGALVELNERDTEAYAAFAQNRFGLGAFELTTAIRVENVSNERTNELAGAEGDRSFTEWLPSVGASWRASQTVTLFAGVHKGFAPPRTEDLIDNSGFATDVRAEESTNIEAGMRTRFGDAVTLDVTLFHNDFDNQIAVGSIAGGSTPLAEGRTRYVGVEAAGKASFTEALGLPWTPYLQIAYTALPTAEMRSPFVRVDDATVIAGSGDGNRLPYAPKHLLTAGFGAVLPRGFDAHMEYVYVDEQYADFANTRSPVPDGNGQTGRIDSYGIWNMSLNWRMEGSGLTLFATAKNLGGDDYIVDRTRGILTAPPRLIQAGAEYRF